MSATGAENTYAAMLEGVGERADQIGPRLIASHWPFVGSEFRRLLIVGQALAGWDDPASPALWPPTQATTPEGREAILAETKAWARHRAEPIDEPLATRSHSPFWGVSEHIVRSLEPDGAGPWQSRLAWWNLFPLGWGDTNTSPWFDRLWDAQLPHIGSLFWEVVNLLDARRVVILAGAGFWPHTASALGLSDLERLPWPMIAGGVRDGRTVVWTRHPGGHYKGVTRPAFAATVAEGVRRLEEVG